MKAAALISLLVQLPTVIGSHLASPSRSDKQGLGDEVAITLLCVVRGGEVQVRRSIS